MPVAFSLTEQKIGITLKKYFYFFLVNMPKSFNLAYNKEQTIIRI
jgi:hypothetical protein